ncbi:MAG TPA: DUF6602 domain-containing protein [Gemmataceae bacterium]|nr:DUF6602 domain-containing protein [Gemmataceae bacterium]
MPRPVHQYVKSQGRKLLAEFEELRGKHKDPDVKGGGNEGIVKEFMQRHLPFKVVVQNTSIIDTNDQQSDELDVVVCNEDQPFLSRTSIPDLLIAEGVDFVLQVKANLTTTEIRRTVRNCRSVKRLQRVTSDNDYILVDAPADIPFFVDRIPYICFAFESRLRLSTVANRLRDECQNTPIEEQPDAVFVLGKGMVVNARNGEGTLAHGQVGFQTASLVDELGDWTLLGLMRSIYLMMPRVRRWQYPVVHYLSTGIYTGGKLLMRSPQK